MGLVVKAGEAKVQSAKTVSGFRNEFRRFLMINQDGLSRQIAEGAVHMTTTDHRVWHALIWHADSWNYVNKPQPWMADRMKLAQSHFNASVRRLIDLGMVIRLGGEKPCMMLNPFQIWKGASEEHSRGMAFFRKHAKDAKSKAC